MQNNEQEQKDLSYFSEYIQAFNAQSYGSGMFMLSPQMLNSSIKDINMLSSNFTTEQIRRMVMQPHMYEQELRKLSLFYFQTISLYQQTIKLWSNMLEFDWEPIPYTQDGKPISISDMHSAAYKKDYAELTKFFNNFKAKDEFSRVLWNMCMYDTYYTSMREYDEHLYLQELPSTHCMIDSNSYLGYLFSFVIIPAFPPVGRNTPRLSVNVRLYRGPLLQWPGTRILLYLNIYFSCQHTS
jgi:hypothetical protein